MRGIATRSICHVQIDALFQLPGGEEDRLVVYSKKAAAEGLRNEHAPDRGRCRRISPARFVMATVFLKLDTLLPDLYQIGFLPVTVGPSQICSTPSQHLLELPRNAAHSMRRVALSILHLLACLSHPAVTDRSCQPPNTISAS